MPNVERMHGRFVDLYAMDDSNIVNGALIHFTTDGADMAIVITDGYREFGKRAQLGSFRLAIPMEKVNDFLLEMRRVAAEAHRVATEERDDDS